MSEAVEIHGTWKRRFRSRFSWEYWLLGGAIAALLAILVLPPILLLVQASVAETSITGRVTGWSLKYFRAILSSPTLPSSFWNSFVFGAGSAFVALVIGGLMAWLVERTDTPFKSLAYATTIISMGTPFILYVVAWLFLLGRVGPLNDAYRFISGSDSNLFEVHSMTGMILIEGLHFVPLVFLFLGSAFRASNADMEEAARIAGASIPATILRISLRLALPALLALALLIFIRAVEAFEVPILVGVPGDINVLTTEIFRSARRIPPDLGYGSAFSVLLLFIVMFLLALYSRLSRNAERFHTVTGKGFRPRPFNLGRLRYASGAFLFSTFFLLLVLPLFAILWMSLTPYLQSVRPEAIPTLSLHSFVRVLADPFYLFHAMNTVLVAAGSASVIMCIVLIGGWMAARRLPFGKTIDQLSTISIIFPGIVLGVAVMQIALRIPLPIYGTLWIILLAYVIKFIPYGMRYVYSGTLQLHPELEQSAGVSGAGILTTLRLIVAPLLKPAILSGWLFIFLIATRELSIAILLASPSSEVLSIVMYDLWTGGQAGELAALGLIWTVIMTTVATIFFRFSRAQKQDAFAH